MASEPGPDHSVIRFGAFELDTAAGELRKRGRRVRLRPQAARLLEILIARSGHIVGRAELKSKLWGDGTFVDFEHGLNLCIREIRKALSDSAHTPRFIETLSRRGYRFIAPVGVDTARAAQPGAIRSLVVLPLQNFGRDRADEYLADGLTEALIAELAAIAALRVISRTSAMQYKRAPKALRVIAGELNVDAAVEGSIQRFGDRIRTTVQLLDAREEKHLWAANYEHDFRDILTLQREVARAVAEQTRVTLTEQELPRGMLMRSVDPEAFEAYLKGRYYANKVTADGVRKAIAFFEEAIDIRDDFAEAHAGLADCYIELGILPHGGARPSEVYQRALASAAKALELDGTLAEAHVASAMIRWRYEWDWAGAEREFRRAIELRPGHASARQRYGWYLFALARHEESLAQLSRALKDDPLSVWIHSTLGLALYYARQYDRAIEHLRETLDMDASFQPARVFLAWALEQKRRFDEAVAEFHKGAPRSEWAPAHRAFLAHTLAVSGRTAEARTMLAELLELAQHRYVPSSCLAPIYAGLGDVDRALVCLAKACDERDGWIVYMNVDPRLDALRDDARFVSLRRRIGLETEGGPRRR